MNLRLGHSTALFLTLLICSLSFFVVACSSGGDTESNTESNTETSPKPKSMVEKKADPLENKGIGPVTSIEFASEVDQEMVAAGKVIYEAKCVACHNLEEDMIGPSQAGVLKRRSPEWIMNLMLNPDEMLKKDPIAKELLAKYNNVPMTDQQLTEEDARKILEFFRTI